MIHLLDQVGESDVLRSWALAEFASPLKRNDLSRFVHADVVHEFQTGVPSREDDWKAGEDALRIARGGLLNGLLALQPRWHSAELTIEDLASLRIIALPRFVEVAPSCLLGELATALGQGVQIDPAFDAALLQLRAGWDMTQMKGRPIIVARSTEAPLYLVEGYSRCSTMLLECWAGRLSAQSRVSVYLGVTERLPEWPWYKA